MTEENIDVKKFRKEIEKGVGLRIRLKQLFHKPKFKRKRKKAILGRYMYMAGLDKKFDFFRRNVVIVSLLLSLAEYAYLVSRSIFDNSYSLAYQFFMTLLSMPVFFIGNLLVVLLIVTIYLDIKIYNRKVKIESVLPDFLQLAAANIRSGMTTDKALWLAIRPQFGVLATEMQMVAKQTMTGAPLTTALVDFSKKYESQVLQRSIHLIVEGLEAGGEIGDLLDRIAVDLQESHSMRKEMAANVTSYVMFITFAAMIAAPFMYGLSFQLIKITGDVIGDLDLSSTMTSSFEIGGGGITQADFLAFSVINLFVSSLFANFIISTIRKGNVTGGLHKVPIFIAVTLGVFWLSVFMFNSLFANFF